MVIAVAVVWMMKMAGNQVIGMIAVRHRFVSAARSVHVGVVVTGAGVAGRAIGGIGGIDGNGVLVVMVLVGAMQMAVVKVIDVAVVKDGCVAAAGAVSMVVTFVSVVRHVPLPRCWFVFARVGERVKNKIEDVLVGKSVENVLPFAAA